MRRIATAAIVFILLLASSITPFARADAPVTSATPLPKILIVEVATGAADANKEFVELYNAEDHTVDISGWKLYKRTSASATTKSTYATMPANTVLVAKARATVATPNMNLSGSLPATSIRLSESGGLLQLVTTIANVDQVVDQFAWGSALVAPAEIKDCTVEVTGQTPTGELSFKRTQDQTTEDFLANFCRARYPTPGVGDGVSVTDAPVQIVPEPEPNPTPTTPDTPANPPADQPVETPTDPIPAPETPAPAPLPIYLSELLIDPVAPQTDSDDEYIELYNPNDQAVTLHNYRLEAGNTWQTGYNLDTVTIEPHGYAVLTSAITPINLTNTGGQLRLLDPNGAVLDEAHYPAAKPGDGWMKGADGRWAWTIKPTPGAANELVLPPPPPAPTTPVAATKSKPAKAQVAVAKKSSTPKVVAAKTTKTNPKKEDSQQPPASPPNIASQIPNTLTVATIGSLIAGYGIYEYRQDIGNFFRRFRKNELAQE